ELLQILKIQTSRCSFRGGKALSEFLRHPQEGAQIRRAPFPILLQWICVLHSHYRAQEFRLIEKSFNRLAEESDLTMPIPLVDVAVRRCVSSLSNRHQQ